MKQENDRKKNGVNTNHNVNVECSRIDGPTTKERCVKTWKNVGRN